MSYTKMNQIGGWLCFLIAGIVYTLTIEPSASFWDCPEFITSAAKLEVGHPPGAPFFMLVGNFFTQFASSVQQAAYMVNLMNAWLSAGCVLFLYLTITHFVRKCQSADNPTPTLRHQWLTVAAGFAGAMAYAFTDTFWFSAVEGEVYAFSSFFTALTFWCILRWQDETETVRRDRWLIFLAYILGLSVGVHLLNLLCIPAIVLVIYYQTAATRTLWRTLAVLGVSFIGIAWVLYGMIPGAMTLAGHFELLTVNHLTLPYNSGLLCYLVLLFAAIGAAIYTSHKQNSPQTAIVTFTGALLVSGASLQGGSFVGILLLTLAVIAASYYGFRLLGSKNRPLLYRTLHTASRCLLVFFIGYSSYATIVIRSAAHPPMNQQEPDNPFSLKDYLGREQYGQKPLFYGATYASPRLLKQQDGYWSYAYKQDEPEYRKALSPDETRYEQTGHKTTPLYQPGTCMLFPRMHDPRFKTLYEEWLGTVQGRSVSYPDPLSGQSATVTLPSYGDNLRFFIRYQLNFMYWRYFLWNFVGRQNDIQGHGGPEHGNWITGINAIDRLWTGPYDSLPDELKQNAGRNVFYGIPLLLGLLGIICLLRHGIAGRQVCHVIFWLFFMTGLAIVIYLNQTPSEVRERDYAYAGSFYAFSIWIGLGIWFLLQRICTRCKPAWSYAIATVTALAVPLQIISQTWDDHDRSGRYLCRDMARNYLAALPQNRGAVLFVNGDNETFPLWYAQDVEAYRTDAQVCNLMYLSGAWYVEQMRRPAWQAPGLPLSLPPSFYRDNAHDVLPVNPVIRRIQQPDGTTKELRIKEYIETWYKEHPGETPYGDDPFDWENIVKYWLTADDESLHLIPTDEIHFRVDPAAVARSGMMPCPSGQLPEKMILPLKDRSMLIRPALVLLDAIHTANWERPLYISATTGIDEYLDLSGHLLQEGLVMRIVPYPVKEIPNQADTDRLYRFLLEDVQLEGLDRKNVYLDETNRRMLRLVYVTMVETATNLIRRGDTLQARKLLERYEQLIPKHYLGSELSELKARHALWLHRLGHPEEGKALWASTYQAVAQKSLWYNALNSRLTFGTTQQMLNNLGMQYRIMQRGMQLDSSRAATLAADYLNTLHAIQRKRTQTGDYQTAHILENWITEIRQPANTPTP